MSIRSLVRKRLPYVFIKRGYKKLLPPSTQSFLSLKHLGISESERNSSYNELIKENDKRDASNANLKRVMKIATRSIPVKSTHAKSTGKRFYYVYDSRIGKREFLPHIQHLTEVSSWYGFFKRWSRVQRVSFITGNLVNALTIHFISGHCLTLELNAERNSYQVYVVKPETDDFTGAFFPDEYKSDFLMNDVDPLKFMVVMQKLSRYCDFQGDMLNILIVGRINRNPSIAKAESDNQL